MRLSLVVLVLSTTLAAAGPLPPFANTSLEASALTSTPANTTLPPDAVAALTKLKAIYDSQNEKRTESVQVAKRGFWSWLKMVSGFECKTCWRGSKSKLKPRSSHQQNVTVSSQESANTTLPPDAVAALNKLKAIYESQNEKRTDSVEIEKRGFWDWLQKVFGSSDPNRQPIPGLTRRSSLQQNATVSSQESANVTLPPDAIVALTKLKAVYESQNEKRTEGVQVERRGFWHWLQRAWGGHNPNLQPRSSPAENMTVSSQESANVTLPPDALAALIKLKTIYDSQNEKRTASGQVEKRGFWHWLKMAWEAPGLHARSVDDGIVIESNPDDAVRS